MLARKTRMLAPGTVWHSLGLRLASACATLALAGCYAFHERAEPSAGPPRADAGASHVVPTVPPRADAGASHVVPTVPPRADAGAGAVVAGRCAELIDAIRGGAAPGSIGCDGRTFPRGCSVPVGECCTLGLSCAIEPSDGGTVEWTLSCDDDCDQSCGAHTLDDCLLVPGCERFTPDACGPAPAGMIEGPACITRRGAPCGSDADCADAGRCQSYWINPCAGMGCDACGGEARFCSR